AIDSSAGAISRIENNQVNPTKETILNIAKILNLNNIEIDYLIGQTALPATEREIESAKEESKEFLITRNRFGYLLDERWKYHLFSKGFIEILSMEPFEIEYLLSKTTVQSLVEKESPIPKRLDVEHYDELLESYLHSYYSWMSHMDDDPTYKDSVKSIIKNSRSNKIWNKIKSKKFTPEESRFVHFNVFGKKFALHYSGLPLAINNRFYLVEYYTENKLTDLLSKYT
ncbi:MAG TPA: helix-turn-helix transcriptional regulator, partial [Candidatus Dojkabacteria bacterium]